MNDRLRAGISSLYVTSQLSQLALHPSGVAKSSTSLGWGKGGNVICAGWQVTLCDPICHVSSHSGEASCYQPHSVYLTFTFTPFFTIPSCHPTSSKLWTELTAAAKHDGPSRVTVRTTLYCTVPVYWWTLQCFSLCDQTCWHLTCSCISIVLLNNCISQFARHTTAVWKIVGYSFHHIMRNQLKCHSSLPGVLMLFHAAALGPRPHSLPHNQSTSILLRLSLLNSLTRTVQMLIMHFLVRSPTSWHHSSRCIKKIAHTRLPSVGFWSWS